ncbi:hypothetical protein ABIA38_001046 [Embleya sp. AB8]
MHPAADPDPGARSSVVRHRRDVSDRARRPPDHGSRSARPPRRRPDVQPPPDLLPAPRADPLTAPPPSATGPRHRNRPPTPPRPPAPGRRAASTPTGRLEGGVAEAITAPWEHAADRPRSCATPPERNPADADPLEERADPNRPPAAVFGVGNEPAARRHAARAVDAAPSGRRRCPRIHCTPVDVDFGARVVFIPTRMRAAASVKTVPRSRRTRKIDPRASRVRTRSVPPGLLRPGCCEGFRRSITCRPLGSRNPGLRILTAWPGFCCLARRCPACGLWPVALRNPGRMLGSVGKTRGRRMRSPRGCRS